MILILMGVMGSGKTTIGKLLAGQLGWQFADADDFHPAANKDKMRRGIPLTDEDRRPWLESLHTLLAGWAGAQVSGTLACSALKKTYRELLTGGLDADVRYILLDPPAALISERVAERREHFMNPELLASQLATLEEPGDAVRLANTGSPEETVGEIRRRLGM